MGELRVDTRPVGEGHCCAPRSPGPSKQVLERGQEQGLERAPSGQPSTTSWPNAAQVPTTSGWRGCSAAAPTALCTLCNVCTRQRPILRRRTPSRWAWAGVGVVRRDAPRSLAVTRWPVRTNPTLRWFTTLAIDQLLSVRRSKQSGSCTPACPPIPMSIAFLGSSLVMCRTKCFPFCRKT